MSTRDSFLSAVVAKPGETRIRPWIAELVSYTSSGRCCHPSDDRLWTAELSASPPRGAAISRAIRPPAAGSPLPVAELPASERRCQRWNVAATRWTFGRRCRLLNCPRRNVAATRWTFGRRCRLLNCPCRNVAATRWTFGCGPPDCRPVIVGTPPSAVVTLFARSLHYFHFRFIFSSLSFL